MKRVIHTTILLMALLFVLLPVVAFTRSQAKRTKADIAAAKEARKAAELEKLTFIIENLSGYEKMIADSEAVLAFNTSNGAWKLALTTTKQVFSGNARVTDDGCNTALMDIGGNPIIRLDIDWCSVSEEEDSGNWSVRSYVRIDGAVHYPSSEFNVDDERANIEGDK